MTRSTADLTSEGRQFLIDRHLASYTCLESDGSPHVTVVGFTWDEANETAWIITNGTSHKARNSATGGPVALCQFEGPQWLSLLGTSRVTNDPIEVAGAVERYARRYRKPKESPERVAIAITVTGLRGSQSFFCD
ncbi:MAG: pyridoxamine 5'-phosphate oxidase family protein [Aquihabitans sp.]